MGSAVAPGSIFTSHTTVPSNGARDHSSDDHIRAAKNFHAPPEEIGRLRAV